MATAANLSLPTAASPATSRAASPQVSPALARERRRVIVASALGTMFEWYDFYLYGTLAVIIGQQFFSNLEPTAQLVFSLLAFAAGFIARPFGSLVFGRLGDLVGRKYTFLITIIIMGASTFLVGVLPTYASIGVAAPIILIVLRLLQGLALGGEYGGAATYVAEWAPQNKRGAYTSWIQMTATGGLLLSLLVLMGTQALMDAERFAQWGWRVPFLLSFVLLVISVYVRLSLRESPPFMALRAQHKTSRSPLLESFGQWKNLRVVILALFGLTAGQAVIWYTGQFYALFYLTQVLHVDSTTTQMMVALALLIGLPFFVVFGALSDRIGRKPIIMAGCLLAIFTYYPAFSALTRAANIDLAAAQASTHVTLKAHPNECSFQFSPTGTARFTSSCDIAKQVLARAAVSYETVPALPGSLATIQIGADVIQSHDARGLSPDEAKARAAEFSAQVNATLRKDGYPEKADPAKMDKPTIVAILVYLVILATMVYGPIAAALVELFPTRIRYTSMSLPYHIGNGWFGGLVPTAAFAIVAQTGNLYSGLWYPIGIAAMTVVIGVMFLPETRGVNIYAAD